MGVWDIVILAVIAVVAGLSFLGKKRGCHGSCADCHGCTACAAGGENRCRVERNRKTPPGRSGNGKTPDAGNGSSIQDEQGY